jgi:hypothetical protein
MDGTGETGRAQPETAQASYVPALDPDPADPEDDED